MMKRFIIIIISVLIVSLLYGCNSMRGNTNGESSTSMIITDVDTTTTTEEPSTSEFNTTEVPKPPRTPVDGTIIAGNFEFDGAEKYYSYIAPISGIYRFDLDINNINYDYRFKLFTPKEEQLVNVTYSDYEGGANCTLEAGTEYYISVIQEQDLPVYTIKIGVPDAISTINGNKITGNLDFINKEIEYKYTPNITGQYRFDFDINDVNCNYKFQIYGEKNELIISGYFDDEGVTCSLEKNVEYKIYVIQITGMPEFEISIGIPKNIKEISDGIISGSIQYTDQIDRYTYQLSKGTYNLHFSGIDADSDITVEIKSSKNEKILTASKSEEDIQFEIDKSDDFTINICQRNGYTKYKIKITK